MVDASNLVLRPDFLDGLNTPNPWRAWVTNWVAPTIVGDHFLMTKARTWESPTDTLTPGTYAFFLDVQRFEDFESMQAWLSPAAGSSTGQIAMKWNQFGTIDLSTRMLLTGTVIIPEFDNRGDMIMPQPWHIRVLGDNFQNPYGGKISFYGARLDRIDAPDTLGVFSGATPDTETADYEWLGEPYASASTYTAVVPDPPGPEPGPGAAARVLTVTGLTGDPDAETLAAECVNIVTMLVRAYTRGRGFVTEPDPDTGAPVTTVAEDVEAVIVTASTRLMSNTSQLSYTAGAETVRDAFKGWSLAETFTLNGYRRRWA